jgi:hypothetical protein
MKVFDTFEQVEGMAGCIKRPIYLMRGIDGELYICDGSI